MRKSFFAVAVLLCCVCSASMAQTVIPVTSNITTSTTWTANNIYDLQAQIYVEPGASLTIQAGTVVASTTNGGGSLAVTQGAQIFIQGTADKPVIMTSTADRATWTSGDPRTGTWRVAANEWGNLSIMGYGYISENATPGNAPTPAPGNIAQMEGLTAAFPGDPFVVYGGSNDFDDSGSISYLSIRYGGKVIGLNNELNGLSLGGVGRNTDIHHVEIMNNVDDGIEIWGGGVNLKYVSIWNVGDDSLDVDQGWRGKAQFGLIVQGYSLDASQGSGVGDNCLEMDGAEDSHWQPVTTSTLYNFTVIGQPNHGDGATAWRDNARVQLRNSIIMDCGEKVVRFDNVDGDGANGYGHMGTLGFSQTFQTPAGTHSTVNAPANPAFFYNVQTNGNLAEIVDTVFYNNNAGNAYTEAMSIEGLGYSIFGAGSNNVQEPASSPIVSITRAAPVLVNGQYAMAPVTSLDPRAANDAVHAAAVAPSDGFFTPVTYRGAFGPNSNWLAGWSAADSYGFLSKPEFTPSDDEISAALGGDLYFSIDVGPSHAGKTWVMAGSGTGTGPLPVAPGITVPLTFDPYFQIFLTTPNVAPFVSTLGVLDANGKAIGKIAVPPGVLAGGVGATIYHAAAVYDTGLSQVVHATNGAPLAIVP